MEILQYVLLPFTNLQLMFFIAAGTFFGLYIGALPGLSVTMAVSFWNLDL